MAQKDMTPFGERAAAFELVHLTRRCVPLPSPARCGGDLSPAAPQARGSAPLYTEPFPGGLDTGAPPLTHGKSNLENFNKQFLKRDGT